MNSDIFVIFNILTDNFIKEKEYEKAILCLEGLCNCDGYGPEIMAKAHLKLSKLLLEKTTNINEAKEHALKSQLILNSQLNYNNGLLLLKLETINHLGHCYKYLGDYDYMIKLYENGVDLCEIENEFKGKANVIYYCRFSMIISEVLMLKGKVNEAMDKLKIIEELSSKHKLIHITILVKITKLQNYIILNKQEEGKLETEIIKRMIIENENKLNLNFINQFKLHLLILEFINNIKQGNYGKYITEEELIVTEKSMSNQSKYIPFKIIKEMDELLNKIKTMEYDWISVTSLKLICLILSSSLFLFSGKFNHLERIIKQGLNILNNELSQIFEFNNLKNDYYKGNLDSLITLKNYLKFKYIFLERQFQMYLLKCEFKSSKDTLIQIIKLIDTWSDDLKKELKFNCHLMIGLYLQSIEEDIEAIKHFKIVLNSNCESMEIQGRIACVLSELYQDTKINKNIIDILGNYYQNIDNLNKLDKAIINYINGIIKMNDGNLSDGKLYLSNALLINQEHIKNNELMYQILNKLSFIHIENGDLVNAHQMGISSYTLSKSVNDLCGLIGSLKVIERSYQNKEKVKSMKNYLNQKEQMLSNKIKELDVKNDKEHQIICNWNLS